MNLKSRIQQKSFAIAAASLMVVSLSTPTFANGQGSIHDSLRNSTIYSDEKVSERVLDLFEDQEKATFLVKFAENADTLSIAKEAKKSASSLSKHEALTIQRSAVVSELKETALTSQDDVHVFLEEAIENGDVEEFTSYFIVNGMAVTATKEIAEKLATFDSVEKILPNEERTLYTTVTEDAEEIESTIENVEWNVERVRAPEVWDMGIDGSGIVVASIDTGAQWDHPGLKEQYRGYDPLTGEVDHDFSFFDATNAGQSDAYDDNGHGTHVTGTMVGAEPNGSNQVGVAPGAEWIAVKAFTSSGGATDASLLSAAEWILAPTDEDGNTRVDLAPDVVNNSWGGGAGLDEWYRDVVTNWRAAEIFPEFSAGNTTLGNPGGPGSVAVPANYPESFATGATDVNDVVAGFSLRGPSPYDEIKPDISAPGVNIRSTVPGSGYEGGWNGTSMAGPAVSGVVALLKQANANLTVEGMEEILLHTAIPLTDSTYPESPNHGYGYGLVNAYDAVNSIVDGLGTLSGQVTEEGDDTEEPSYTHTPPNETYEGMDLTLTIEASDNVSISSVILAFTNKNGENVSIDAERISGNYESGTYSATIPGEDIAGDEFNYSFAITDFGQNEVVTETYVIPVLQGISVGYFEDFEEEPTGWQIFGQNSSWEWGVPTSGPNSAASGEHVYATNLSGPYGNNTNATLVMPPIDLPEGAAYLQYKRWFNLESNYDFAHVFISTDMEDWTQLERMNGLTADWEEAEIDLSEYSGERVYIGFNLTTDFSVVRDGLYIDDVTLSDESIQTGTSLKPPTTSPTLGVAMNQVGLGASNEKISLKEKVNPSTITPEISDLIEEDIDNKVGPQALPLAATVEVKESGRAVQTNPANGTFTLLHGAGEFTAEASAYGYHSESQAVTIEADGATTANFMLNELVSYETTGQVLDEATGEPIAGATLMLVEDANVTPVQTDAEGAFSFLSYEGEYTLRVTARGYHATDIPLSVTEDRTLTVELEPFYTIPGGEIGYDDGTAENARAFYEAGNGWAVKMSLPEDKETAIVTDGIFRFWDTEWPVPGGTEFAVEVWDASGENGLPGDKLAGPIEAEALRNGEWTFVDLSEHAIQVSGDFYMVYIQTHGNPNTPGLATDENGPLAERSYQYVGGSWSPTPAAEGNYMIRAGVDYEVSSPVITSPAEDFLTNEAELTVEGTASPTTQISLRNNGEEVASDEIGSDGEFALPITLTEGINELYAVSVLNGTEMDESNIVTVTLDTIAPELTIDSPADGDKINRETVTVEGTVTDENLDYVEVNGQTASIENGQYSKRILLDNGTNDIEVVAVDLAGNETSESVSVEAKYDAPVIENLTPAEDKNLSAGESVKIEFESEPGLRTTFMIHMPLTNTTANATELPMMEMEDGYYVGYYTATSNVVADGAVIEVKAVDSFGNESRKKADGKLFINVE